jgi:cardiolipin synthase
MVKPGKDQGVFRTRQPWKREKLYFQGDAYFNDVLKATRGARRRVDFEVYIFEKGALGDRVIAALLQAAQRGVKVRLLVDGIGSPQFVPDHGDRLAQGGVSFRVYRFFPSLFKILPRFFTSWFNRTTAHRFRSFRFRMNRRDHRKLIMVDGERVWLGGFNVSDQHLESVVGKKAWRDTGLGLSGVREPAFQLAFETAWYDKYHRRLWKFYRRKLIARLSRKTSSVSVQINAARRLRSRFHRELLAHLGSASRRIWVTTPYFVPAMPVLRALRRAAQRGCDVRLVLPEKSDVPFVRWASMTFFHGLLSAGCRIFEYHKSILHAQTLMVDDWALVGSSNFNHRSFFFDLEVDVVLRRPSTLRKLERQYVRDFERSRELLSAKLALRAFWERALTRFFFLLHRWL